MWSVVFSTALEVDSFVPFVKWRNQGSLSHAVGIWILALLIPKVMFFPLDHTESPIQNPDKSLKTGH